MRRKRLLGIASIPLSVIIVLSFCKGVDAFLNKEWVTPSEGNLQTERTSEENKIDEVITTTPGVTQEQVKGLDSTANVINSDQEETYLLPTQNFTPSQLVAKCSEEDITKVEEAIVIGYTNIQILETDKKEVFDDCKADAWGTFWADWNSLFSGSNAGTMTPEQRLQLGKNLESTRDTSLTMCQTIYDTGYWNKEIEDRMKAIRNAEQWLADCE